MNTVFTIYLVMASDKKMLDLASTGLRRIHSVFKNFYSGEWIKKLQDLVPYV